MKILLFIVLTLHLLTAHAQTPGDYRSKASGAWSDTTIWERYDGNGWQLAPKPPAASDGVIRLQSPYTVTISNTVSADQLVVDAGATLAIPGFLSLQNSDGDDLACNGVLVLSGNLLGAGSCLLNGVLNWSGGALNVPLTISGAGTANLLTSASKTVYSPLSNAGIINLNAGSLLLFSGNITNSGTFRTSGDGALVSSGNATAFNNNGTFEITGTTAATSITLPFNNTGIFNLNAGGTTTNTSTFTNSGTINVPAGATFSNSRNLVLNAGTTFGGSGIMNWSSQETVNSSVSIPASLTLNKTNGSVAGTGTVTISGAMNWTAGVIAAPFLLLSGSTLTMAGSTKSLGANLTGTGTINWTAGNLELNAGIFSTGGTFTVSFNGALSSNTPGGEFKNFGLFQKTVTTGITTISSPFTNSGSMAINAGTLQAGSVFTNKGPIDISSGASFISSSYLVLDPGTVLSGSGSFTMSYLEKINTALNIPASLQLNKSGDVCNGSGQLTINGTFNWTGGNIGIPLTITKAATMYIAGSKARGIDANVTNDGVINWIGGFIGMHDATFTNNGLMTTPIDEEMAGYSDNGVFLNTGTFNKTSGSFYTNIGVAFVNTGTVNVSGGNLTVGHFSNSGKINLVSSSVFASEGDLTINSGTVITGLGTFFFNGEETINAPVTFPASVRLTKVEGSTHGTAPVSVNNMNWYGGRLQSPFIVPAGGTMNWVSNDVKYLSDTLTNYGNILWNAGYIQLDKGTVYNRSAFYMLEDGLFLQADSGSLFLNSGSFNKTGGGNLTTSTLSLPFTNTGILRGIGNLSFPRKFMNTGRIEPGWQVGTFGVMAPNDPVLTAGSTVSIEIWNNSGAGTGYDQLKLGSQELTGNLVITEYGTPPDGTYTIISSTGTLTGAFSSITKPDTYTVTYTNNSVLVTRQSILPVKLLNFKAVARGSAVDLLWKTGSEYNSDRFVVERSRDGTLFSQLGSVASRGDSLHKTDYTFPDNQPSKGINYYRLKMVDRDGHYEYSSIVNFDAAGETLSVTVYPNPVHSTLTVSGLQPGRNQTVRLADPAGHIVYGAAVSTNRINIDLSRQAPGIYWLQVFQDGKPGSTYKVVRN